MREDIKREFRDFINEAPVAVIDDWGGFKTKDLRIGKRGIELDWKLEDNIKDKFGHKLQIYSCDKKYILGAWGREDDERAKEVFVVMVQSEISNVETSKEFKDKGLAELFCSWFLYNKYTLISDIKQL